MRRKIKFLKYCLPLGGFALLIITAPVPALAAASSTILISVPFTTQAPLGEWSDARQQGGCEEASAAMAMVWVRNDRNISARAWRSRILATTDFEQKKYGEHRDVALPDVVSWIFKDYYNYQKVNLKNVASTSDIVNELEAGNIVMIPTNGRALKNPYFVAPGPEEHMLLIKGYDYQKGEFIVNDPGTRHGASYLYSAKIIFNSIRPYKTGYKLPFPRKLVRQMIVVRK